MFKTMQKKIGRKFLAKYKSNKQKSLDTSLEHCLQVARSMLNRSKYCFLITNNNNQSPSARMVQPIVEPETFTIWLGTNPALRKVKEIEEDSNVTIAFGSDKSNANLIVYGQAEIVRDVQLRKKHWINSWILFFPRGPKGDDFVSIKIELKEMELMNFKENIVPEPFGLKPVRIKKELAGWEII